MLAASTSKIDWENMKKLLIPLLAMFIGLSFAHTTAITIQFAARVGDQAASCGVRYQNVGIMGSSIEFQDLRFYVSNLRLITTSGEEVAVQLDQDSTWQYENVALLDFEDASALCEQGGNKAMNHSITGTVPEGNYSALAFSLGVPFALNHADVTLAPAPLNISSLWWNWQGGYKHARIDIMSHADMMMGETETGDKHSHGESSHQNDKQSDGHGGPAQAGFWPLHLGSTGCQSEASTIAPVSECANPNTVEILLGNFDLSSDIVVADILSLLQGVDLSQSLELMPPGCMSGPSDPDCSVLFSNLGLSPDSQGQNFFHLGR